MDRAIKNGFYFLILITFLCKPLYAVVDGEGGETLPDGSVNENELADDFILETELDDEAELEGQLADVLDVFTDNDGALDDDDLSDNKMNDLSQTDLADPGADRIVFWDDGDTQFGFLTPSTGLTLNATNLTVDLGTSIQTSEIDNDEILAIDLDATNTETDEDIVTYESGAGGDFEFMSVDEVLDNTFSSNGFLRRTGAATYSADSEVDISDDTNLSVDDGLSLTGDELDVVVLTLGSDGDSTTTEADGGLEIVGNELTLLRGCSDNQGLVWDESADDWNCEDLPGAGAGSGTMTTIKESDSQVGGNDIVTIDFGAGFDVAETPDTEVNITLNYTEDPVDLSTTEVTGTLDISDHTNLTAGTNITLTGDDLSVDDVFVLIAGDTMTGDLVMDNQSEVRWTEADVNGSNYLAFTAPAAVTANITCTLENDSSFIPDSCVGDGSDADTQLTQEQVEDFAGGMWTLNTETRATVTYQDSDGTIDIVVDDMNDDQPDDDSEVPDAITVAGGTINTSSITLDISSNPTTDGQVVWNTTSERIQVGDDGVATLDFYPGAHTTDTNLSQEEVEDYIGGMLTGNTETRITVTYQDGDGTIDFVVDDFDTDTNADTICSGTSTYLDGEGNCDTLSVTDEWTDGGTFLHPADLSGAEDVIVGGTTVAGADIILGSTGAATFNEQQADVNFRVEGSGIDDLIVGDAGLNSVGIGETTPLARLEIDVGATDNLAGLYIDHNETGNAAFVMDSEATTIDSINITTANTTEDAMDIAADSLTSGSALEITSSSTNSSSRSIVAIGNLNSNATGAVLLFLTNSAASRNMLVDQNANEITMQIDSEATTTDVIDIPGPKTTTGKVIDINADDLTTGAILELTSNSSSGSARDLVLIDNQNAFAISTNLLKLNQETMGDVLQAIVASTRVVTVNSSGNMGLGPDTSPDANLEVGDGTLSQANGVDDLLVQDDIELGGTIWTGLTGSRCLETDANGGITVASGDCSSFDTDTNLTEEQVEDFVGGMVTGNTETGITVTYQDADGTLDFVVSGGSAETLQDAYDNDADGSNSIITFTTADDSIEFDNPSTSGTDSAYQFKLDQNATTGVDALVIEQAGTSADVIDIVTPSTTSGVVFRVDADSLTTGKIGELYSNSSSNSSRTLLDLRNQHASADNTEVLHIRQAGDDYTVYLDVDGDSTALLIDTTSTSAAIIDMATLKPLTESGNIIDVSVEAITTGNMINLLSNSASTGSREMVLIDQTHASAVNAIPLKLNQDSTADIFQAFDGGAEAFDIQDGGDVTGTHGTYHTSSDRRLKKDIKTIEDALEKVNQLSGVTYRWKDKNKPQDLQMGLIAQEVEPIVPEVVNHNPHTDLKAVEYQYLVALLIEAVKDLTEEVEQLKEKVQ